jgi:predicted outer membrane lipoprotein
MLCVDIEDSLRLVGQYQVSLLWKLLNSISFATGVVQALNLEVMDMTDNNVMRCDVPRMMIGAVTTANPARLL